MFIIRFAIKFSNSVNPKHSRPYLTPYFKARQFFKIVSSQTHLHSFRPSGLVRHVNYRRMCVMPGERVFISKPHLDNYLLSYYILTRWTSPDIRSEIISVYIHIFFQVGFY